MFNWIEVYGHSSNKHSCLVMLKTICIIGFIFSGSTYQDFDYVPYVDPLYTKPSFLRLRLLSSFHYWAFWEMPYLQSIPPHLHFYIKVICVNKEDVIYDKNMHSDTNHFWNVDINDDRTEVIIITTTQTYIAYYPMWILNSAVIFHIKCESSHCYLSSIVYPPQINRTFCNRVSFVNIHITCSIFQTEYWSKCLYVQCAW